MTNLESKMTNKTPKNKAETPVSTPVTLAGTTHTARGGESKSRTLPQADALKARFKAGSIPLQTDFADLIDLANMGRQAVGGTEGQTGPANGFTLSEMGRLELKPDVDGGITIGSSGIGIKGQYGLSINKDGVSVKTIPDYGIGANKDGIWVKVNNSKGIMVDKDGVAVKVNIKNGLKVTAEGVGVNDGLGLEFSSTGQLNLKVKENGGVNGGPGGVSVIPGNGITVNSSGVNIKLAVNSGLSVDKADGLKIAPEQTFQKGMVMMFAGTEAEMPKGWALCDGSAGRPDLRDRFVLGAAGFDNINKTNNKKVAGQDIDKKILVDSDEKSPKIDVTVDGHVLSNAQMPEHNHLGGMRCSDHVDAGHTTSTYEGNHQAKLTAEYGYHELIKGPGKTWPQSNVTVINNELYNSTLLFTSSTGGAESHAHGANATQIAHKHSMNVVPPYYILAFIIKL